MPDKRVMKLWVEALESGEYPQTRGTLNRTQTSPAAPSGFCCLGVLCEVAIKDGVPLGKEHYYGRVNYFALDDDLDNETSELPWVVCEWAGFSSSSPLVGATSFIEMNDTYLKTFPEIASVIREEYLDDNA